MSALPRSTFVVSNLTKSNIICSKIACVRSYDERIYVPDEAN